MAVTWQHFPIPTGTVGITQGHMQELWTAFGQRLAGLNQSTNFTYTRQALVTNVTAGVTNYYLTNSTVTVSNDLSGVWFTQQPLRVMLNTLFPYSSSGPTPWDDFVTSNSVDQITNTVALTLLDMLPVLGNAYWYTNVTYTHAAQLHGVASNLAIVIYQATGDTFRVISNGDLDKTYGSTWQQYGARALSNSTEYIIYKPAVTNATNITVKLEGWTKSEEWPGVFTNETVALAPNVTTQLDYVYVTYQMLNDGLAVSEGFEELAFTRISGTLHTGDQVVVWIDRIDKYAGLWDTWLSGNYQQNPFFDTRTILNDIYRLLDEMRCCIIPSTWSFLDGYIGRDETDDLAYSNRVQQTGMAFSLDGGGTGYGRLAQWNGPVWAGIYNIYPSSNEWNYATLWTVTNQVFRYWTGQAWQMQYRWTNSAPFAGTFDANGLGYTQDVVAASGWLTVTNAAMIFPDTMGSTNPATITPDSERGFRATVPTLLLRLDTDTNFICTPR